MESKELTPSDMMLKQILEELRALKTQVGNIEQRLDKPKATCERTAEPQTNPEEVRAEEPWEATGPTGSTNSEEEEPNYRVAIDILGPLVETELGEKYCLVMIDTVSGFAKVTPLRETSGKTIAEAVTTYWIEPFGCPRVIACDSAHNLTEGEAGETWKKYGIRVEPSIPRHPQGNGMVERVMQMLKKYVQPYEMPEAPNGTGELASPSQSEGGGQDKDRSVHDRDLARARGRKARGKKPRHARK